MIEIIKKNIFTNVNEIFRIVASFWIKWSAVWIILRILDMDDTSI